MRKATIEDMLGTLSTVMNRMAEAQPDDPRNKQLKEFFEMMSDGAIEAKVAANIANMFLENRGVTNGPEASLNRDVQTGIALGILYFCGCSTPTFITDERVVSMIKFIFAKSLEEGVIKFGKEMKSKK